VEGIIADSSDVFVRPSFYEIARDYLDPLKRSGVDTLVLGCTHFPLLAAAIQQTVGPRVSLISSAEETAYEVAETLSRRGHLADPDAPAVYEFATTGDVGEFERLGSRVIGRPTGAVSYVPLDELTALPSDELLAMLGHAEAEEPTCA
jgi:glutamate racemase